MRCGSLLWFSGILMLASLPASAGTTKEECLEAHGRGQDLRERGQLVRAKLALATCAQNTCPQVVQNDCARMVEELGHVVPTVTFAARDGTAGDLPNTTVYVDDVVAANRLDDGKSYEVDPGRHVVRYVHEGREATLRVVVNQGEKGRVLVGVFPDAAPTTAREAWEVAATPSAPSRPLLPLFVAGVGAAATIAGGILVGLGLSKVPSSCSVSSHECAAAPGDPAFGEARSGVSLVNTGMAVGMGGAVVLGVGLVWYLVQPTRYREVHGALEQSVITF